MFILKSLFHSLASLRISDAELVRHALKSLSVKRLLCNSCNQTGRLKIQSHYHRYCIHAVNGRRIEETVSIPLLVCSSCGASQAVLPDALIPFGSYSVRFVGSPENMGDPAQNPVVSPTFPDVLPTFSVF